MSSRDRDSKSLQDKLKVFFKKGPSAPLPARNELAVSAELERELSAETPQSRRLRALKELADKVLHIRVQDGGVERLWSCTRDLLEDPNPEARHTALGFLRCVADGQAEWLGVMRTILFRYLRETHATHPPEDSVHRFKLLHTLTNTGKNIKCFEEQIGSFLVEWLPQIQSPTLLVEFLQLVINVVKFNASYLDEEIVHAIVNNACYVCAYWSEGGAVLSALSLLEAVVSYSLPPRAALRAFVAALCRTVNIEHYCQPSWKLMRCVVGADIGHAALQEMADILCQQEAGGEADAGLLRGAVFYINMALWGPRRVPTLKVSFLAVLPAFQKALQGNQPVVTYEVVLALQSLVARVPHDLTEPAWDALLHILRTVIDQDKKLDPPNELIHSRLHALITSIEQLEDAGHYTGDSEALLDLIDYCGHDRPESSTLRVVSGRAALVSPSRAGWLATAAALADRYIRLEPRLSVRLHTLHALHAIIKRYRHAYEEELLERVGVPVLSACALDADAALRAAVAKALAALAEHTSGDACTDLIDLLEKIMNRPFEVYVTDVPVPQGEGGAASGAGEAAALRAAAEGLAALARARLLRPPAAHALRTLLVLINHLDTHYKRPALFQHHPDIRIKIFDLLFCLRANAFNHVGMCSEPRGGGSGGSDGGRARPTCSPLLLVEPPAARGHPPHAVQTRDLPSGACILPVGRAAHALTTALTRETDWTVLSHVLRALPALLQVRALAVGRRAHDIDLLASTLCSMLCDRSLNLPETLRAAGGGRVLVSEFHAAALPALGALAPYHAALEPHTQQRIVRCLLKYGMVLRTPQPYINALTIFTLETRDTMVKMLPEVLLDLSKISDTKVIASPMLEFLSTLTRLPRVFASFVEDQYMSVFAILLPYTNPSRYNHYVVSLAHHVIAAWFLKCRLSYRRNFVRFIIHGLHNYIIMPFEEQLQYKSNNFQQATANEDSSNRKRSSSLGSKGVSRAPLSGAGAAGVTGAGSSTSARGGASALSASAAFHVELTETCVDLLARYTFTPCSVKPHRSEIAEFLFNGGQSTTWLVGHKLITITTSGCLQNTIKQGLCDRCAVLCRQHTDTASSPLPGPPADRPDHPAVQVQVTDGSGSEQPHANNQPAQTGVSEVKRQNSAENKTNDPVTDALNNITQRFEKISKEVQEGEEGGWSRVGALAGAGACPCWCAHWAEVHVRSPTGDVAWVMRMQNQMSWDYLSQSPLQEVLALLAPRAPPSSASSGIGDSRHDVGSESDGRSRSGSGSEPGRAADLHPQDLHKSSSDSVVAAERKPPHAASHCIVPPQPHRMSTQPINIPGSPQRQSSSSTTDDDDLLLLVHEGKFRHPVRRSNSSPEMSSSWKLPAAAVATGDTGAGAGTEAASRPPSDDDITVDVEDMILLPSCEPTSTSMSLHASKKAAKKSDMRVSCEAIPEEMSGTSPLAQNAQPVPAQAARDTPAAQPAHPAQPAQPAPAPQSTHHHPHLMTYNSDPGTSGSVSETGVEAMPTAAPALQKVASDSIVPEGRASKPPAGPRAAPRDRDDLPPLARSKRSNTISVMSPTRRHRETAPSRVASAGGGAAGGAGAERDTVGGAGGGVTPSFVLLQLYHNMSTYPITPPVPGEAPSILNPLAERPLKVTGVQNERTIKNLDLVPPVETYKVGVLYVGPGQQDNEVAILKNEYGSVRYAEFLSQLGSLVSLDGSDEQPHLFLNLEKGGKDGHYTYVWHDDIMQVLFHVATAMPSSARDPSCNEKRKYIGNDFVSIVYNDSGADFNIHTIKGQFNFCIVVVEPFEHGLNRVFVKTKDERIRTKFVAHLEPHVISDQNVPLLARQMALHCSLASQISQSLKMCGGQPYASNSLERLRHIKRLRARLEAERLAAAARAPAPYADTRRDSAKRVQMDDFNDYT